MKIRTNKKGERKNILANGVPEMKRKKHKITEQRGIHSSLPAELPVRTIDILKFTGTCPLRVQTPSFPRTPGTFRFVRTTRICNQGESGDHWGARREGARECENVRKRDRLAKEREKRQ